MRPARTIARRVILPLVATLVLGPTGCSGDDDSSGGNTNAAEEEAAAQAQTCDDWAQVESEVTALVDVDVVADGTDALRTAVDGVAGAVQQLGDSAGEQVGDEVDALGRAVDDLRDELRGATDDPAGDGAGSGMAAVGEAIQGVTAATDELGDELQSGCGT
jgi:hypothetical protein